MIRFTERVIKKIGRVKFWTVTQNLRPDREEQTTVLRIEPDVTRAGNVAHFCGVSLSHIFMCPPDVPLLAGVKNIGSMNKFIRFFIRTNGFQKERFTGPQVVGRGEVVFKANVTIILCVNRRVRIRFGWIVLWFFVDEDGGDIGSCKNSSLQSNNSKVLRRKIDGIHLCGLHVPGTDAPVFVDLSAEARTKLNGGVESDASWKERTNCSVAEIRKEIAILKEELSSFGEEEFEAIEVRHLTVYFYLREIRVDREI